MIKVMLVLVVFALPGLNGSFTSARMSAANTFSYVSPDEEVSLNIERGKTEVKFDIAIKHVATYDHILIERSSENMDNFGKCKYISCSEMKQAGEVACTTQADFYPYSATKDVYYRIKTVTRDGVERAYPPVLLPPVR